MAYFFIRRVKLTEMTVKVQRISVQKKEVTQYNKTFPDKPKALEGRIQHFLCHEAQKSRSGHHIKALFVAWNCARRNSYCDNVPSLKTVPSGRIFRIWSK